MIVPASQKKKNTFERKCPLLISNIDAHQENDWRSSKIVTNIQIMLAHNFHSNILSFFTLSWIVVTVISLQCFNLSDHFHHITKPVRHLGVLKIWRELLQHIEIILLICLSEQFQFVSQRHRGFPFSITLYINGIMVARLSSCCEYRYAPGFQQGRKSCFRLIWLAGGIPCYRFDRRFHIIRWYVCGNVLKHTMNLICLDVRVSETNTAPASKWVPQTTG